MNERIRELVAQCQTPIVDVFNVIQEYVTDDEKFAELILKECIDICDSTQAQYGQYTFTATTVKNKIKERFGVEE